MFSERVILAPDDDGDLYSGFNEYHPALDPKVSLSGRTVLFNFNIYDISCRIYGMMKGSSKRFSKVVMDVGHPQPAVLEQPEFLGWGQQGLGKIQ